MKPQQTKLALVPTASDPLRGPRESRNFIGSKDSPTRPSAANPADRSARPSAEILRACDILRDVLLRDDEEFSDDERESAIVGQVSAGVLEIVDRLHSLAGLQMMFEGWKALR